MSLVSFHFAAADDCDARPLYWMAFFTDTAVCGSSFSR